MINKIKAEEILNYVLDSLGMGKGLTNKEKMENLKIILKFSKKQQEKGYKEMVKEIKFMIETS